MADIKRAQHALDLPTDSVLKYFKEIDPYNNNEVEGFICHQSDERYGALHIQSVNGCPTSQTVYCTPKLRYPFAKGDKRVYKFPLWKRVYIYPKIDGTNICAYSYETPDGKRCVTFKTRLRPFVSANKYGDFKSLWGEILEKYPAIKSPREVKRGVATLSFEMFGSKNPLLIYYNVTLDVRLLFGVVQDGSYDVVLPEAFDDILKPNKAITCVESGHDTLEEIYERTRKWAEQQNKSIDENKIAGVEGTVFYVVTPHDKIYMYKNKPPSVEAVHFASDVLPAEVIRATALNALESVEGNKVLPHTISLLREEFDEDKIEKSELRIEKVVSEVIEWAEFREKVLDYFDLYKSSNFFANDKGSIMTYMSRFFTKNEMKKVYRALEDGGYFDA